MLEVRGYFREHRDVILTLLFVILVDHFVFDGSFREKLKGLLDSMIAKVSKKVEEVKNA
jgi:hypothetical protein